MQMKQRGVATKRAMVLVKMFYAIWKIYVMGVQSYFMQIYQSVLRQVAHNSDFSAFYHENWTGDTYFARLILSIVDLLICLNYYSNNCTNLICLNYYSNFWIIFFKKIRYKKYFIFVVETQSKLIKKISWYKFLNIF